MSDLTVNVEQAPALTIIVEEPESPPVALTIPPEAGVVEIEVPGPPGRSFKVDATGLFSERSLYDAEDEGFSFLATDQGMLYIREGAAGGWSDPIEFGRGEKGEKGDPGDPGEAGASAYEVAVANGFVGTEAEWLASLEGPQGEPGDPGDPGEPGQDGRGFTPRGAWTPDTAYSVDDLVQHGGSTYRVQSDHTSSLANLPPDTPTTYEAWALKGEAGEQGDPGDPGEQGLPGPGLPAGGTTGQLIRKKSATDYDNEYFTHSFAATTDSRFPSSGEKAGLAGTSGTPSDTNRYVTDQDARNTNARTPTAHASTHQPGGDDAMAVDAAAGTGSLRTLGTGAQQAAPGSHVGSRDPVLGHPLATASLAGMMAAADKAKLDRLIQRPYTGESFSNYNITLAANTWTRLNDGTNNRPQVLIPALPEAPTGLSWHLLVLGALRIQPPAAANINLGAQLNNGAMAAVQGGGYVGASVIAAMTLSQYLADVSAGVAHTVDFAIHATAAGTYTIASARPTAIAFLAPSS